ncbi:hypothetical protein LEMLEM_LOCUS17647, partial [Lemmus lemmus]
GPRETQRKISTNYGTPSQIQLMHFHKHGVDWNEELDPWESHVTSLKVTSPGIFQTQNWFSKPC